MSSLNVCILLQAFLLAFVQSALKQPVDYALFKKATQSSTMDSYGASGAVDFLFTTSCQTEYAEDPWWSVDLGAPHLIKEIRFRLALRGEPGADYVDVLLSKEVLGDITEANDKQYLCGRHEVDIDESNTKPGVFKCLSKDLHNCVSIRGRGKRVLTVVYVHVHGSHFRYNLAFSKSTNMSSTEGKSHSSRAVDGSFETGAWSGGFATDWWSVDLGAPYLIEEVVLYKGRDDVNLVYLSNGSSSEKLVECGNTSVGLVKCSSKEKHQYVVVQATSRHGINLLEVQVYGDGIYLVPEEPFTQSTWMFPLLGALLFLGLLALLGFIALRLSKKKAKVGTVANGSNGQK